MGRGRYRQGNGVREAEKSLALAEMKFASLPSDGALGLFLTFWSDEEAFDDEWFHNEGNGDDFGGYAESYGVSVERLEEMCATWVGPAAS